MTLVETAMCVYFESLALSLIPKFLSKSESMDFDWTAVGGVYAQ